MNRADRRGRFFSTSQYSGEETTFGATRGFSRLWDTDGDGVLGLAKGPIPNGWTRGQIVRMSQPAFVLTQLGPPLDKAGPAGWRPGGA